MTSGGSASLDSSPQDGELLGTLGQNSSWRYIRARRPDRRDTLRTTAYFFGCSGTIYLLRMLWLAEYDIDAWSTARFAIGALIVGKVAVVLENTPIGERFRHHAIAVAICLFGAYLGFNISNEISRAMGPQRMKALFLHEEGRALVSGDGADLAD